MEIRPLIGQWCTVETLDIDKGGLPTTKEVSLTVEQV